MDLSYLDSANALLGPVPSRQQLKESPSFPVNRTFNIRIVRTLPFEFISNMMPPFFGLWGAGFTVDFSDYDTAISNVAGLEGADAYIFWLDWRLYRNSKTAETAVNWLKERIDVLRSSTAAPIFINNWPEMIEVGEPLFSPQTGKRNWTREFNVLVSELAAQIPDCAVIDLACLANEIGESFFDDRNDTVSNYPFSNKATIAIARHIGVHLFPAVYMPRIKAIAIDLDDTLYNGVLGEEGIQGIRLTDEHLQLHKMLLRLKQSGILLAVCSRNEEKDVKALFEGRMDFLLSWDDFAVVCANWLAKPDNMVTIAQKLNIDPSAILFIDDNPAELLKMADRLPSVLLLHAARDGKEMVKRICNYPGLYLLREDKSAIFRTADVKANIIRETLKSTASDHNTYLESLHMHIRLYTNNRAHASRIYELSRKTNQFNLALHRFTEIETERVMDEDDHLTITVHLTDSLTDSGIIGAFICHMDGEKANLKELLFSCRALGREIETVSFSLFLEHLMKLGVDRISISVTEGPRNQPAREWLARFVEGEPTDLLLADLLLRVKAACFNHPAKVEVIT